MAGGSGTRFWPQSRKSMPKQLLKLAGERTLIQSAFDRTQPDISPAHVWVVTNSEQVQATRAQLPELPARHVLVEPCGRNTAPCIGLAAIQLLREDPHAVMVVMPADHVITPPEAFRQAVDQAAGLIEEDPTRLVLFGVPPHFPAVGYGYIERGAALDGAHAAYRVASFREKPDRQTAQLYQDSGEYYWNCGIFVWRADTILSALERFEPEIHVGLMKLVDHIGTQGWQTALEKQFPEMKSISIDFAVLERADNLVVLEAPFQWDDVGSWQALERLGTSDEQGNTVVGLHLGIDTTGCIIRSSDEHLVATIGLKDCIVVHTPDATLVAPKNDENALRELVDRLKHPGYDQFL
jgi:mannose-1-phosphate guanylyltransferase